MLRISTKLVKILKILERWRWIVFCIARDYLGMKKLKTDQEYETGFLKLDILVKRLWRECYRKTKIVLFNLKFLSKSKFSDKVSRFGDL